MTAPATPETDNSPTLGDLVIVLLASTLAGLRDRLHKDGFHPQGNLVDDLVETVDDYLTGVTSAATTDS